METLENGNIQIWKNGNKEKGKLGQREMKIRKNGNLEKLKF